ncbi:unnamed protein product [Blepharisma stoltei]|uniref:Uncharacterized protein n=1 Tax=Blepharisma stoltei TaxID=1481888 RepID=A0AAU9JUP0_9CILI|nr:unnamed protein product [Blepharisma stoltei]
MSFLTSISPDVALALAGGFLVSLATALNLLVMGRITSVSSMIISISRFYVNSSGLFWRISFLLGLLNSVLFFRVYLGDTIYGIRVFDVLSSMSDLSLPQWIIGSFFIGMSTNLGGDFIVYHIICGLPRLSRRSMLGTAIVILFGAITLSYRHSIPSFENKGIIDSQTMDTYLSFIGDSFSGVYLIYIISFGVHLISKAKKADKIDPLFSFAIGIIFGLGFILSGLCRRTKVIGFLNFGDNWDPTIAYSIVAMVGFNWFGFNLIFKNVTTPLLQGNFNPIIDGGINMSFCIGAALFGIGWGILGFCNAGIFMNIMLLPQALLALIGILMGNTTMRYLMAIINSPGFRRIFISE